VKEKGGRRAWIGEGGPLKKKEGVQRGNGESEGRLSGDVKGEGVVRGRVGSGCPPAVETGTGFKTRELKKPVSERALWGDVEWVGMGPV